MPEGPEIRLAADAVEAALRGRKTTDVFFAFKDLKRFESRLTGCKVRRVETRGKAMVTLFDNDLAIYSHNQLYGIWKTANADDVSATMGATQRQLRLGLHNKQQSALLYSASQIEVLKTDQLEDHPFLAKLGPDLLSQTPSVPGLVARLSDDRFRKRQFAGLLLDQTFVAGLGNYLRAEILLFAGIHPKRRPVDCTSAELKRVSTQIIKLTERSYRTRGIINPPRLVKELKANGLTRREQHRFSVYRRDGKPCYHCETEIKRIDAGGRPHLLLPWLSATACLKWRRLAAISPNQS